MRLPPKLVLDSIDDFCVLFFKDVTHTIDAPPHFYLTFPVTKDSTLIICIFTSQIDKNKNYYNRANKKAVDCLLTVNNAIFEFLTEEDSVIDCNRAELLSKEELRMRIDTRHHDCEIKTRTVPDFIRKDVMSAIIRSPLIDGKLKKIIRELIP